MFAVIMMAVLTIVLSLTSCNKESQSLNSDNNSDLSVKNNNNSNNNSEMRGLLKVDLRQGYLRVTNEKGEMVNATTPGSTLLYTNLTKLRAPIWQASAQYPTASAMCLSRIS